MFVKKRMKPKPRSNSHKGYHNIRIHTPPKRRSTNSSTPESESPPLSYVDYEDKYDKKWFANKFARIIGIIIISVFFVVFSIIIYTHIPSTHSPLPPKLTTKHESHSHLTLNKIISPQFNVDESIANRIPQINSIQGQNIHSKNKKAVVYFLEQVTSKHNFCALLLSLSSIISSTSTTSLQDNNIEIIVFVHYTLTVKNLDLDKLAARMNFKIVKYELTGSGMLEHIIRKLHSLDYDSVIYVNWNTFILQDLSVLFESISVEKYGYNFGVVWSFDNNGNDGYEQCLLPSLFVMNINHISKDNVNYMQLFTEQSLCKNVVGNDDVVVNVDDIVLNKMKEISEKYGIVSLPWWYVMDHMQFKTYYKADHDSAVSEPIPLLIDFSQLNDINNDLFWTEWLSKRQTSIEFCQNIAS